MNLIHAHTRSTAYPFVDNSNDVCCAVRGSATTGSGQQRIGSCTDGADVQRVPVDAIDNGISSTERIRGVVRKCCKVPRSVEG